MFGQLIERIGDQHDLRLLPQWGPYTKKYLGTSHIADPGQGLRFDLSVFPGYYRRRVEVPNVLYEGNYYPWSARPDLSEFTFRQMLEWKDRVYADVTCRLTGDGDGQLITVDLVNNTAMWQILSLHLIASLHFPAVAEYQPDNTLFPARPRWPDGVAWLDGLDYCELRYAVTRPTDNLVADGKRRGEVRGHDLVNGGGVELGFDAGDQLVLACPAGVCAGGTAVLLRYIAAAGQELLLTVDGREQGVFRLSPTRRPACLILPLAGPVAGRPTIALTCRQPGAIVVDGLALGHPDRLKALAFPRHRWQPRPRIRRPGADAVSLKYPDVNGFYGLKWSNTDCQVREFICRDLDSFFPLMANDHVKRRLVGEGRGHYTDIFLRPLPVEPRRRLRLEAIVTVAPGYDQLRDKLAGFHPRPPAGLPARLRPDNPGPFDGCHRGGRPLLFGQQLMQATLLTNVVYPVYTRRSYIRHSCPGKWWDCLYTWDSGFIGLGLLEHSLPRAVENLCVYLTPPGDQSAFVHHGSPVPVQHYLAFEIWNRCQDKDLLAFLYPRLRQYYLFLRGRLGSSTTARFRSGLLQTWDYFYNSGGWDDYPPQKFLHDHGLAGRYSPVITTAHCIRLAKFLGQYCRILGQPDDQAEYDGDISLLSAALQTHAWDREAGYFSYVGHDQDGNPREILRHRSGQNFNMGLDGVYPLVAGACTPEQQTLLASRLRSPRRFWTKIGLSAVDRTASYYRHDGYWNGTVWMAHQWFFWKAMLDLGHHRFARRIAMTALKLWQRECRASYRTLEHFVIASGRGAGWHAFGGLSAPVVSWFAAYFVPGTVNTGFDTIITAREVSRDRSRIALHCRCSRTGPTSLIAALDDTHTYRLTGDGRLEQPAPGQLVVTWNAAADSDYSMIIERR
ncbi:MAG: hypothetical protein N3A57_00490 [Negativicutes bacterium]|nr:hypothetical protein [Negativicutes bacterium]